MDALVMPSMFLIQSTFRSNFAKVVPEISCLNWAMLRDKYFVGRMVLSHPESRRGYFVESYHEVKVLFETDNFQI